MTTYIHGTNSATLFSLKNTDFTLCTLNTMLFKYGFAPMAGEIFLGGVVGILDDVSTAFGTLEDGCGYSLSAVTRYAGLKRAEYLNDDRKLDECLRDFLSGDMVNSIRCLIVDLLRHKQASALADIPEKTKAEFIAFIETKRDETIKRFIANYAAARFMFSIRIPYSENQEEIKKERKKFNSFKESLWQDLPVNFLDLELNTQKDICAEIVKKAEISHLIEIDVKQNFPKENNNDTINYDLTTSLMYPNMTRFIDTTLTNRDIPSGYKYLVELNFDLIKNRIQEAINRLNAAADLLKNIVSGQHKAHTIDMSEPWIQEQFPVIILSTDDTLFEPRGHEYRARREFKLGADITRIAVPEERIPEVQEYFAQHGVSITVVAISTLSAKEEETLVQAEPVKVVAKDSKSQSAPILTVFQTKAAANGAAPLPKGAPKSQIETGAERKVSELRKIFCNKF